ncbi:MAG TPA: KH domain-containing protein [Thermomicrobiales bacterium]|nr:KH domain-containing protein [Thermomicrobiales bacterium]
MVTDERDNTLEHEDAEVDEETFAEDAIDEVLDTAAANGDDPVEQLRGLVVWLVGHLVDEPDHVSVDANQRGSMVQIQVRLPEDDLGKMIGRGGRIAKSIRTALMIAGSRYHLRVSLDIEGQG